MNNDHLWPWFSRFIIILYQKIEILSWFVAFSHETIYLSNEFYCVFHHFYHRRLEITVIDTQILFWIQIFIMFLLQIQWWWWFFTLFTKKIQNHLHSSTKTVKRNTLTSHLYDLHVCVCAQTTIFWLPASRRQLNLCTYVYHLLFH